MQDLLPLFSSQSHESDLCAIRTDPRLPAFFDVHWVLTRRCSYACSYCPPHRHNPRAAQLDAKDLLHGLERLCHLLAPQNIRINLTGGEPTIHPSFLTFVGHAARLRSVHTIRVVTNLASSDSLYGQLAEMATASSMVIQLVASFHLEQARPEAFLRRVRLLLNTPVGITVKMMLGTTPPPQDLVDELNALQANTSNLTVCVQPIRGTAAAFNSGLTTIENQPAKAVVASGDSRILVRRTNRGLNEEIVADVAALVHQGRNHFRGWECDAGRSTLFVDSEGQVYSAHCKPEREPLFYLHDDASEPPPLASLICPHSICECASTVMIPKRRLDDRNM